MYADNSIYLYILFQYIFLVALLKLVYQLVVKRELVSNVLIKKYAFCSYFNAIVLFLKTINQFLWSIILIILCMYLFIVILCVYCIVSEKKSNFASTTPISSRFSFCKNSMLQLLYSFFKKQQQLMPVFNAVPNI